jgi:RNA polymerase sigma-54 factor
MGSNMSNMELWTNTEQQMEQRPAATLVAFASLLALPSWELEQAMHQEIANNPALELVESDVCPRCGNSRNDGVCYFCLEQERFDFEGEQSYAASEPVVTDEEFDLFSIVAAPRTLAEELTELAHAALAREDHFIADFLIGSLNDNGMLDIQIGDAVRTLGIQPQRVREILATIQRLGPPGVASRDAQECLLLQIERLEAADEAHPLARAIIENHLKDLAQGRYVEISQALDATTEQVMEARDFIRDHLRPYPILKGGEAEGAQVVDTSYATPDVIIRKDINNPEEFTIEVMESRRFALRISPMYREIAQTLRRGDNEGISEDERRHVLDHVARAQQFIGHLRERRNTLERVAMCAIKHQHEYLTKGVRYLTPLTRLQVAEELKLHVSTVSRAVADKYVLLPWQQVKPMRIFFEAVRSIHDVLQELIVGEDRPLTDIEIAERLAEQGYQVARRTVAKYRKQLGILPSTLR